MVSKVSTPVAARQISSFFNKAGISGLASISPSLESSDLSQLYNVTVGNYSFVGLIYESDLSNVFELTTFVKESIGHDIYESVWFFADTFEPCNYNITIGKQEQIIYLDKMFSREKRICLLTHCSKFSDSPSKYLKKPAFDSNVIDVDRMIKNYGVLDDDDNKIAFIKDYM